MGTLWNQVLNVSLVNVMMALVILSLDNALAAEGIQKAGVVKDVNLHTMETVSYTHLDVYKRQSLFRVKVNAYLNSLFHFNQLTIINKVKYNK